MQIVLGRVHSPRDGNHRRDCDCPGDFDHPRNGHNPRDGGDLGDTDTSRTATL